MIRRILTSDAFDRASSIFAGLALFFAFLVLMGVL